MNFQRGLSYFGGVVIILLILGSFAFALLPMTIKWQANSWFEDQGLVSRIDDVEINLTDGQFIVREFTVNNADDEKRLNIGKLLLQVSIRELFNKNLLVEKVEVTDLHIDVEQDSQGLVKVAGVGAGSKPTDEGVVENNEADAETSEDEPWRFTLNEILLGNIEFCYQISESESSRAFHDCMLFDAFSWNGHASYTLHPDIDKALSEVSVGFDSSLSGFSINDIQLKRTVMRFDELRFEGVNIKGVNDAQIGEISLRNYQALQKSSGDKSSEQAGYLLSSELLTLKNLVVKGLVEVEINALKMSGLNTSVLVNEDGSLEIQNALKDFSPPMGKTVEEIEEQEVQAAKSMQIKLGELVINGDSSVSVRDESVKPVFSNTLSKILLDVKNVDMSDKSGETQVKLSLVVGEHGEIKTEGKIQLFADKPTAALESKVVGINIGDFDAYANQLVQHKVKSGHLDADFDVKIDKGNLDTRAAVKLHKFYVENLDEKEASQYKEKLGVPLGSALSLLRDRDDSISIKMPVTGDVENPDFSLTDIIRKVSVVAIKEAVINYYTPFGLVKLLAKGFDLATALRFEPVLFEAGKGNIDQQDTEQLDKIAKLLIERPGVHLVVCGHATQQDFNLFYPEEAAKIKKLLEKEAKEKEPPAEATEEVATKVEVPILEQYQKILDDLAANRGKAVKQYLVDQHKIGTNRLILCNPRFDYADEGEMRTEISI